MKYIFFFLYLMTITNPVFAAAESADASSRSVSFSKAQALVREFLPEILSLMEEKRIEYFSPYAVYPRLEQYANTSVTSALDYIDGFFQLMDTQDVSGSAVLGKIGSVILYGNWGTRRNPRNFYFNLGRQSPSEDVERLRDDCFEMGVRMALPYHLNFRAEWGINKADLTDNASRGVSRFSYPPHFYDHETETWDPQTEIWQKHGRIALLETLAAIKVTLGDLVDEDKLKSIARESLNKVPPTPHDDKRRDPRDAQEINDLIHQYLTITPEKQARIEHIFLQVKRRLGERPFLNRSDDIPELFSERIFKQAYLLDFLKRHPQPLSTITLSLFSLAQVGHFAPVVDVSESDPYSGWKIHVGANMVTASEVALVVTPYLLEHAISSKIVNSERSFSGMTGTQAGKLFTIYPKSYQDALRIATDLNRLLNDFQSTRPGGPIILSDNEKPFGDAELGESGLLFVRYGQHKERRKNVHNVTRVEPGGGRLDDYVRDSREVPFPDFVLQFEPRIFLGSDNPFPDLSFRWTFPGTNRVLSWLDLKQGWGHVLDLVGSSTVSNQERFATLRQAVGRAAEESSGSTGGQLAREMAP